MKRKASPKASDQYIRFFPCWGRGDIPRCVRLVRISSFSFLASSWVAKLSSRGPASDTTTIVEQTRRSSKRLLLPLPILLFSPESGIMPTAQWDAPSMTFFVVAIIITSNTKEKEKGRAPFCLVKPELDLQGYRSRRL